MEWTGAGFPKWRYCPECGAEFKKEDIEGHTDHMRGHNPSPAQWAEANKRINEAKEKAKQGGTR